MGSIAAKEVAKEVLESLGKGKRPVLGKIALKKGYAKNTADNPKNITETKSYKEVTSPIVKKMVRERERVMKAMAERELTGVQYDKLSKVLDELTKNIQLLSGGETERLGIGQVGEDIKRLIDEVKNDN